MARRRSSGRVRLSIGRSPCKTSPSKFKRSSSNLQLTHGFSVNANIRVVVRIRPENSHELCNQQRNIIEVVDDRMLIFDPNLQKGEFSLGGIRQQRRDVSKKVHRDQKFTFDCIFPPGSNNTNVFERTTSELIDTVFSGYNCSVFVYGATGAGKTYTMAGTVEDAGVTFRTVMAIYNRVDDIKEKVSCEITVSYFEIYNEGIIDLINPGQQLTVREDGTSGTTIPRLSVHKPQGADDLLKLLIFGNSNRTQHATDVNAESSRSHSVFQVFIRQRDRSAGLSAELKLAKLSMIDLAGSERGSATSHTKDGFRGARFREGTNINKSLLALGNCINALAEGSKYIPYRNSKLTRLLKDSIGGNCKTIMIANISPSGLSYEDTYNTLKYADRAKKIKTKLKKNLLSVNFHVSQYAKIVDELKRDIIELQEKITILEKENIKLLQFKNSNSFTPPLPSQTRPISTKVLNNEVEMLSQLQEYASVQARMCHFDGQSKLAKLKLMLRRIHRQRCELALKQMPHLISSVSRRLQSFETRLQSKIDEAQRQLSTLHQYLDVNAARYSCLRHDLVQDECEKTCCSQLSCTELRNEHSLRLLENDHLRQIIHVFMVENERQDFLLRHVLPQATKNFLQLSISEPSLTMPQNRKEFKDYLAVIQQKRVRFYDSFTSYKSHINDLDNFDRFPSSYITSDVTIIDKDSQQRCAVLACSQELDVGLEDCLNIPASITDLDQEASEDSDGIFDKIVYRPPTPPLMRSVLDEYDETSVEINATAKQSDLQIKNIETCNEEGRSEKKLNETYETVCDVANETSTLKGDCQGETPPDHDSTSMLMCHINSWTIPIENKTEPLVHLSDPECNRYLSNIPITSLLVTENSDILTSIRGQACMLGVISPEPIETSYHAKNSLSVMSSPTLVHVVNKAPRAVVQPFSIITGVKSFKKSVPMRPLPQSQLQNHRLPFNNTVSGARNLTSHRSRVGLVTPSLMRQHRSTIRPQCNGPATRRCPSVISDNTPTPSVLTSRKFSVSGRCTQSATNSMLSNSENRPPNDDNVPFPRNNRHNRKLKSTSSVSILRTNSETGAQPEGHRR